jgi:hypothetical protein
MPTKDKCISGYGLSWVNHRIQSEIIIWKPCWYMEWLCTVGCGRFRCKGFMIIHACFVLFHIIAYFGHIHYRIELHWELDYLNFY